MLPGLRTTHDWAHEVDVDHLDAIRSDPSAYAPDVDHLVLEVLAYALDEAREGCTRSIVVRLGADGVVVVEDDGRGTDTRRAPDGGPVVKPVMATRDLRFFDDPGAETLADGVPRRGISVVAALSDWLEHDNRRAEGAWTRRYVRGVPDGPLVERDADGTTGTTVRFRPTDGLGPSRPDRLRRLLATLDGPAAISLRSG